MKISETKLRKMIAESITNVLQETGVLVHSQEHSYLDDEDFPAIYEKKPKYGYTIRTWDSDYGDVYDDGDYATFEEAFQAMKEAYETSIINLKKNGFTIKKCFIKQGEAEIHYDNDCYEWWIVDNTPENEK